MSILDTVNKDDLKNFLSECASVVQLNEEDLFKSTIEYSKRHDKKKFDDELAFPILNLETIWYQSLETGIPNYSVYEDPYYFSEVWLCWSRYSRRYLKDIQIDKSLPSNISIIKDMKNVNTVIDLGCGFGYTTTALKEIFPNANVFGTNIEGSHQYNLATKLSNKHDFRIVSDYRGIKTDLIFASEYFEHFEEPITHLKDVISECNPKYMLIANSFGPKAIGHFNYYKHEDKNYPAKQMGSMFNRTVRELGYEKVKTNCWNNRPVYYKRMNDDESYTPSLYNL